MKTAAMKVRIPYVMTQNGKWCAHGYPEAEKDPDWSMMEEVACFEEPTGPYARGWITVEIPVPGESDLVGDVES